MSTFGSIKTKIEETFVNLYSKPEFKKFTTEFKTIVLENKDLSELYYIYDDLSSNKGVHSDIVDDYLNESIEYSQILIESSKSEMNELNKWITYYTDQNKNNYSDIDNVIYNNTIRNLESVLESKKNIKKTIIKEGNVEVVTIKETTNLPISVIVDIANSNLKNELVGLAESEKKELEEILTINGDDLKNEIESLKETVKTKLNTTLNESTDDSLTSTIQNTINKLDAVEMDHYNLYKLRKLNEGL
jgi:hypothetical protein